MQTNQRTRSSGTAIKINQVDTQEQTEPWTSAMVGGGEDSRRRRRWNW
jgi:hypothetical protein